MLAWQALFTLKLGERDRACQLLVESVAAAWTSGSSDIGGCDLLQMALVLYRARAAQQTAALLVTDIDDFRRVNQAYGHHTGDLVLVDTWRLVRQGVEAPAIAGRWGGEEFAILLPGADEQDAIAAGEGIRERVQDYAFVSDDGREVRATVSVGVALYPRDAGNLIALHERADGATHLAKEMGKNRVHVYRGTGA